MRAKPSVLVAMSGGVDSSVAACLLAEAGYEVLGSHLRLVHDEGLDHGCCGPGAERDARDVASVSGFPFEVVDLTDVFEERVVADYVSELEAGRTPNPCVRCNERIKFGAFLERARNLGVEFVATGHYVRTVRDDRSRWHLYRGADRSKDQSYVLHMLGQEELSRSLFPVGSLSKDETRARARRFGLEVAAKPDSQELCFVSPGQGHVFAAGRAPHLAREGEIVDPSGNVIGAHGGTYRYTIGQRRGLGVSRRERSYVVDVDAAANRVVVGPAELLARRALEAERVNWIPARPAGAFEAEVKIRYRGDPAPAVVEPGPAREARVEFRTPQRAVTPGQSVVFYAGDEVVGGGTITAAIS
ncbi:MAG TPA: tRNA 2-thiouridine(34) synthase MnmA [Actinomycetota bacterium]|jgi:tRNA-specific 2-thiouridylase|nr:tRNA 2-thiouridine(34) synthase MnmA [Actinomycetota bacterium]